MYYLSNVLNLISVNSLRESIACKTDRKTERGERKERRERDRKRDRQSDRHGGCKEEGEKEGEEEDSYGISKTEATASKVKRK